MVPMGNYPPAVTAVLFSALVAVVGMLHSMRTTNGSARGLLIVWVAYFMLTVLPTYLLLRFGLFLPTIVLVVIVAEALIRGDNKAEVEGFYPGFIVITPVILLLLCLFAGIEIVLRSLV